VTSALEWSRTGLAIVGSPPLSYSLPKAAWAFLTKGGIGSDRRPVPTEPKDRLSASEHLL
jgi:hypothetical protein